METQLVVLGGGPGGYAAAFLAADLGMEVTLVEQQPRLGGVCLLRGCIPSKALLHVAKLMTEAKHLVQWGIHFSGPRIDIDALRARKDKVIATLTGGLAQLAKRRNVRVITGRAVLENSQTLRLEPSDEKAPEEERLQFRHAIVATGSAAVQIPGWDYTDERLMSSRQALDLRDVPESLLVVGGGYIGLELGTVYAALGSRVSVVEMTDGLLPGVDRDLVKPLAKRLEKTFSAVYLGTKVAKIKAKRQRLEVAFEGRADATVEQFDRVLVAVGRRPNSRGLGLENTQVQVDQYGFIRTDNRQRSADPHILAIGDVAGQPMLAHKAAHQGKVAVEALADEPAVFEPRAVPAVVFTDPEIAWAGLTETQARARSVAYKTAVFPWAASGRAQSQDSTDGMTKWLVDPHTDRVLGCGIVGAGAGELVAEAVLAIELGATVRDVADSIHPHPTLSETLAFAAEVHLGTATDLYRPRRSG